MEQIRQIIRKILKENIILSEININPKKPENYAYHIMESGTEKQYTFYAEDGFGYHLSFKESKMSINDDNIKNAYGETEIKNKKGAPLYRFVMINFFPAGTDPEKEETFDEKTKRGGSLLLIGNILWMLFDFIEKNPNERCFAFAADDKRMNLYSNVFKNLENIFHVFPKKNYDNAYKDEQVILIKK